MSLDWDYLNKRADHFVGRSWVFTRIREFLSGTPGRFILTGSPGSGKTAVASRLAQAAFRPTSGGTASLQPPVAEGVLHAAYFCRSRRVDLLDVAQELADQLARNVDGFAKIQQSHLAGRATVKDVNVSVRDVHAGGIVAGVHIDLGGLSGEAALVQAVITPLRRLRLAGNRQPIAILVDAVDEAMHLSSTSLLPELLAQLEGIHLLITSRPERRVLAHIEAEAQIVDLLYHAPEEADDLGAYILERLSVVENAAARAVLRRRIAEEADGNFLYAYHVLDTLLSDAQTPAMSADDAEQRSLPAGGIVGVYRQFLTAELTHDEDAWWERLSPIIGSIAVGQGGGLDTKTLQIVASAITGRPVSRDMVRRTTKAAGEFLQGPAPDGPFRLYHHSFAEFLQDPENNTDYLIDTEEVHRHVVEAFINVDRARWTVYAWDHLGTHAYLAGASGEFQPGRFDVLFSLEESGFLTDKLGRIGSTGIGSDYELLLAACEQSSDLARMLRLARERVELAQRTELVVNPGLPHLGLVTCGADEGQRLGYLLGLTELLLHSTQRTNALLTVLADCPDEYLVDPRTQDALDRLWDKLQPVSRDAIQGQLVWFFQLVADRLDSRLDWAEGLAEEHIGTEDLGAYVWSALSLGHSRRGQDEAAVACLDRALVSFTGGISGAEYNQYIVIPGVEEFFTACLALNGAPDRARLASRCASVFDAFASPVAVERIRPLRAALLASAGKEQEAAAILRRSLEVFNGWGSRWPVIGNDPDWERAIYLAQSVDALAQFRDVALVAGLESGFRAASSTLTGNARARLASHLVKLKVAQAESGLMKPARVLEDALLLGPLELGRYGCEGELIRLLKLCAREDDSSALEWAANNLEAIGPYAKRARITTELCRALVETGRADRAAVLVDEVQPAPESAEFGSDSVAAMSTAAALSIVGRQDEAHSLLGAALTHVQAIRDDFDRADTIQNILLVLPSMPSGGLRTTAVDLALAECQNLTNSRSRTLAQVAVVAVDILEARPYPPCGTRILEVVDTPILGQIVIRAVVFRPLQDRQGWIGACATPSPPPLRHNAGRSVVV